MTSFNAVAFVNLFQLDDNHIMANYLTDIITWDGFKGQHGLRKFH